MINAFVVFSYLLCPSVPGAPYDAHEACRVPCEYYQTVSDCHKAMDWITELPHVNGYYTCSDKPWYPCTETRDYGTFAERMAAMKQEY